MVEFKGKFLGVVEFAKPYIFLLVLGLVLACFMAPRAAIVIFPLTVFTLFFFRDPERFPPSEDRVVVSPADGRVMALKNVLLRVLVVAGGFLFFFLL